MCNKSKFSFYLMGILALILTGCASVHVYKVDIDSNGKETVNTDVEGIPYYMPRPYFEVYEPFVVSTEPYFVKARLTSDGKYLLLESLPHVLEAANAGALFEVPSAADKNTAREGFTGLAIADYQGAAPSTSGGGSNVVNNVVNAVSSNSGSTNQPTALTNSVGGAAAPAGIQSVKVSSSSDFYITPGRRFFEIVYLPDYSDKRIIQTRAGLGQANLSVVLAQGWSLSALNSHVDNSELAKEVFKTYDVGLQLAQKLAAASLFPPAAVLQGATPKTPAVKAGDEITCKLTVTTIVAPGLYPFPKDVELPAKYSSQDAVPDLIKHLRLKTYSVYVVSALLPTGDSPLNFTPYGVAQAQPGDGNPPAQRAAGSVNDVTNLVVQAINTVGLSSLLKGYSGKLVGVTASAGSAADHFKVVLTVDSLPVAKPDQDALQKTLTTLAQSAVNVKSLKIDSLEIQAQKAD